jgi:hypothetical protein
MFPSPEVRAAELDGLKEVEWRCDVLKDAGYEWEDAKMIARRRSVDLHKAVELKRRGCNSFVARRILL